MIDSSSVQFQGDTIAPLEAYSSLSLPGLLDQSNDPLRLAGSSSAIEEIAFVDAALPDVQTLVDGLKPGTAVYLLNPAGDELSQMSQVLAGYSNLSAVHLFSHGSDGVLQLGNTQLDGDDLIGYGGVLQSWSKSLAAGADLLLYGCGVAEDAIGQNFVQQIAALTGADVAASSDLTGSTALGGNWTLEYSTGSIEANDFLQPWAQAAYNHVLATYTVTNINDSGAGSLRSAIAQANASVGVADTINFNLAAGSTITLSSQLLLTDSAKTTIDGAGAVTISGNNATRVFSVNPGATAELIGLTISGGKVVGLYDTAGGISNGGTLTVSNSTISNNSGYYGGGIYNNGTLTVSNSTISSNNSATDGGGIYNNSGTLTVSNSTISYNSTNTNSRFMYGGGGIYNKGTVMVSDSTISNNSASDGAGMYNLGGMTVSNSTISNNWNWTSNWARFGGGIYNNGSSAILTVSNSTISNNRGFLGGGINNSGRLTVSNSTFSNNSADQGGGIYNGSMIDTRATVSNSTFSNNVANSYGGGILNSASLTVSNSTISNNSAAVLNKGGTGGGINNGGTLTVSNSIVAGNTTSSGSSGREIYSATTVSSGGYNLFGYSSSSGLLGVTTTSTDITPTVALNQILSTTLANNGGPTQTLALVSGSAAINAGDPNFTSPPSTDQRGFNRVSNGRIDIGAFEVQNSAPVNTVPATQTTLENTPLVFSTANANALSITDDSPNLTTTVSVANGTGILSATTGGGATLTNNGTNSVTIAGTTAQINAALAGLIYTPTVNAYGTGYAILTLTTFDGSLMDTDTVTIDITPI